MVSSRHCPETGEVEDLEVLVVSEHDLDKEDRTIIEDLAADGLGTRISIMSQDIQLEVFP